MKCKGRKRLSLSVVSLLKEVALHSSDLFLVTCYYKVNSPDAIIYSVASVRGTCMEIPLLLNK